MYVVERVLSCWYISYIQNEIATFIYNAKVRNSNQNVFIAILFK